MATPETLVKNRIIKYLKSLQGCDLWWYKASDKFTSGIPDFILCYRGMFVTIEVKAPGKKSRGLQAWTLDVIERAGGKVLRNADSIEKVKGFMEQLV